MEMTNNTIANVPRDQQAQRIGELAGLLREVRGYYKTMPTGMGGRIDAALAEVK